MAALGGIDYTQPVPLAAAGTMRKAVKLQCHT
jgi:hypothetical protein